MTTHIWQVESQDADTRLDKWLADAARLGSRSRAFDAIAKGKVYVNAIEQTSQDAGRKIIPGESIKVWVDKPGSAKHRAFTERKTSKLHLVYEDEAMLVINKPAGMLTVHLAKHPFEETLFDIVCEHVEERSKEKPLIVHRIDRDSSGLVVFAKTQPAREKLKTQFFTRQAQRTYRAVVYGCPKPDKGEWRDFLVWDEEKLVQRSSFAYDREAKEAKCSYEVLNKLKDASYLEVKLLTGKQNQIRAQAALHGHPLVGEKQYISATAKPPVIVFPRQALHAFRLEFAHPINGNILKFEAAVPSDLEGLVKKLR